MNQEENIECEVCKPTMLIMAKRYFHRIDRYELLATCNLCVPSMNSIFWKYEEISKKEYVQRKKLEAFR